MWRLNDGKQQKMLAENRLMREVQRDLVRLVRCLEDSNDLGVKIWGVEQKIGFFTPQIIHFNRVFHYFHHPFWVFSPIFGNTHIMM